MPESFHVDRHHRLSAGQVLRPNRDLSGMPISATGGFYSQTDLENFFAEVFDEGVSQHGRFYLFERYITSGIPHSEAIELVVELVRRATFPTAPSRFACVFGSPTVDDARQFKAGYGPDARIWRVSYEESFTADMNLLKLGYSLLGAWLLATKYWRAESSPDPIWEQLLVPPVRVLERIE